MDFIAMDKSKKGLILTTWERCKSFGRGRRSSDSSAGIKRFLSRKTKSCPRMEVMSSPGGEEEETVRKGRKGRVAPEGCFTVYVGEEKQRFVIRTEFANHPLFRMLLEEAEAEYGFNSQAPLSLPCDVDFFYRVLMEMDDSGGGIQDPDVRRGCGYYPKRFGSYHLLTPSRALALH